MTFSVRAGLARLGVKRLMLAIHDASFPVDPDEDLGRGSPASRASERLFAFARGLGFTGIQLGPQGQTARDNPSPYDGTLFSRNLGNLDVRTLRPGGELAGLVKEGAIDAALVTGGGPAQHRHAHHASHALVAQVYAALERGERPDVRARIDAFRAANRDWLEPDALHAAVTAAHGGSGFREWPDDERELWLRGGGGAAALTAAHARAIDRYALGQMLVCEDHARVRARAGLQLYGDFQVGYSDADAWRFAGAFLRGYAMGAPPSRTNPEGQPWGYPVLDPAQYAAAVRDLVVARADKAFGEYDGLRIDHPHGLVCPWVYRGDVKAGARLFESPDLADHPELAAFAIVRSDQIQRDRPRYADDWVRELDDDQVARYAVLIDLIVDAAARHGRSRDDLSCEVLSTMPLPLGKLLARHGLGRWRVTQKAKLDDPTDVYRCENAERPDWVMLGNHDTAPIFAVIRGWSSSQREAWARHLAARLALARPERLASDGFVANAMLAEVLACRAENVSIFFADLWGYEQRFNVPGVVSQANWTLRLPPDFERVHADRLAHDAAIDLPLAVELALAAPR